MPITSNLRYKTYDPETAEKQAAVVQQNNAPVNSVASTVAATVAKAADAATTAANTAKSATAKDNTPVLQNNAPVSSNAVGGSTVAAPAAASSTTNPANNTSVYDQVNRMYQELYGYLPDNRDYSKEINDIYDKAYASQLAQLQSSYDQVQRSLAAEGEKIPRIYQQQGNALAADYERQRANMNERMAASGINSGAGTQAALAQSAGYLSGQAQIKQAQADAQAELEREIASQEAQYQYAINQALADNDYKRAVALTQELKDYQSRAMQIAEMGLGIGQNQVNAQTQALYNQQSDALDRAKLLAGYGDFSGFAQLYGQDAADNMRAVWLAQNPQYAYMTGNLSAADYYKLTGKYPADAQPTYNYVPTTVTPDEPETPEREVPSYTNNSQDAYAAKRIGDAITRVNSATNQQEAMSAWNAMSDGVWDSMTAAQQQQVLNQLKKYGIG